MLYYIGGQSVSALEGMEQRNGTGKSHDVEEMDTVGTCSFVIANPACCRGIHMARIVVAVNRFRPLDVHGRSNDRPAGEAQAQGT